MQQTVSYSIDKEVLTEFKEFSRKNSLNASKFMENVMKAYIQEQKSKEKELPNYGLPKTL